MFNKIFCSVLLGLVSISAWGADVATLLKEADRYRLAADAMRVDTQVQLYKNGKLDKERRYSVYTQPGRRSLVVSKTPGELGQKVLMLDDQFWIILPTSQRPIRITPLQKLLGEASTGDIATMTWSEDYTGVLHGEANLDGIPALRLDLTAIRTGVSYTRIELYLARSDHHPVSADLYVASGKLAKRAVFAMETVRGQPQVTSMTLVDALQPGQQTVIRYLDSERKTLPDEVYNPMFLVRNGVTE